MLTATLTLALDGAVLIKQEEHHANDVEGYTGEHLIRGEEGFTFCVVECAQHDEHVDIWLSDPVDDEGLHRDPARVLPRFGWRRR